MAHDYLLGRGGVITEERNHYWGGRLIDGYDYLRQAWVVDGRYVRCGHIGAGCDCYGRLHAGEDTQREEED